jgi:hypothetical protein
VDHQDRKVQYGGAVSKLSSLEKRLRLLDAVATAKAIGLRELTTELGFPPSTVHRLMTVLTTSRNSLVNAAETGLEPVAIGPR